jgi:hypothetical protein
VYSANANCNETSLCVDETPKNTNHNIASPQLQLDPTHFLNMKPPVMSSLAPPTTGMALPELKRLVPPSLAAFGVSGANPNSFSSNKRPMPPKSNQIESKNKTIQPMVIPDADTDKKK